ncbi:MAG TPA: hypothetical protein VHZ24_23040 [Pirellulales bacterium]|jgi:hypothetical protein|nr:hypothetical protein [Pirellulales bacterium]
MPSVALCPHCRGIIAIVMVDDTSRLHRCPRCAAIFHSADVAATLVAEPPLAMSVEPEFAGAEGSLVTTTLAEPVASIATTESKLSGEAPVAGAPAEADSAATAVETVAETNGAVPAAAEVESAPEAWSESLSSAEGAGFAAADFDDPTAARPYHEDPQYNRQLAVEEHNGSAWPELAAALAAERAVASVSSEGPPASKTVEPPHASTTDESTALEELPVTEDAGWTPGWEQAAEETTAADGGGEGFALAGAATEFAPPAEIGPPGEFEQQAPRPSRVRRSQGNSSAVMIQFGGMVLGGALGLALGYIVLLWAGVWLDGSNKDFLKIGTKLPAWMVPAVVRGGSSGSAPRVTNSESEERRRSFAEMANEAYESSAAKDAAAETRPGSAP